MARSGTLARWTGGQIKKEREGEGGGKKGAMDGNVGEGREASGMHTDIRYVVNSCSISIILSFIYFYIPMSILCDLRPTRSREHFYLYPVTTPYAVY